MSDVHQESKIKWVKPRRIEVLRSWNTDGNARKEERRKMDPSYIWWTILKERIRDFLKAKRETYRRSRQTA